MIVFDYGGTASAVVVDVIPAGNGVFSVSGARITSRDVAREQSASWVSCADVLLMRDLSECAISGLHGRIVCADALIVRAMYDGPRVVIACW